MSSRELSPAHRTYNKTELEEFKRHALQSICRNLEISGGGKNTDIIKRIIAHQTGDSVTPAHSIIFSSKKATPAVASRKSSRLLVENSSPSSPTAAGDVDTPSRVQRSTRNSATKSSSKSPAAAINSSAKRVAESPTQKHIPVKRARTASKTSKNTRGRQSSTKSEKSGSRLSSLATEETEDAESNHESGLSGEESEEKKDDDEDKEYDEHDHDLDDGDVSMSVIETDESDQEETKPRKPISITKKTKGPSASKRIAKKSIKPTSKPQSPNPDSGDSDSGNKTPTNALMAKVSSERTPARISTPPPNSRPSTPQIKEDVIMTPGMRASALVETPAICNFPSNPNFNSTRTTRATAAMIASNQQSPIVSRIDRDVLVSSPRRIIKKPQSTFPIPASSLKSDFDNIKPQFSITDTPSSISTAPAVALSPAIFRNTGSPMQRPNTLPMVFSAPTSSLNERNLSPIRRSPHVTSSPVVVEANKSSTTTPSSTHSRIKNQDSTDPKFSSLDSRSPITQRVLDTIKNNSVGEILKNLSRETSPAKASARMAANCSPSPSMAKRRDTSPSAFSQDTTTTAPVPYRTSRTLRNASPMVTTALNSHGMDVEPQTNNSKLSRESSPAHLPVRPTVAGSPLTGLTKLKSPQTLAYSQGAMENTLASEALRSRGSSPAPQIIFQRSATREQSPSHLQSKFPQEIVLSRTSNTQSPSLAAVVSTRSPSTIVQELASGEIFEMSGIKIARSPGTSTGTSANIKLNIKGSQSPVETGGRSPIKNVLSPLREQVTIGSAQSPSLPRQKTHSRSRTSSHGSSPAGIKY